MGETKRSLIILFEGPDAAGKGGAIKRIVERLDPRLLRVHSVIKPTSEEYAHHYLWRFWNKLPPYGQCAIFDRSWYGRVLVERVEKFATEREWRRAYREINEFERLITDDGAIILKFYLQISKAEQLARFKERQEDPYKHWKINEEDWRNRNKWKEHNTAAEEMFEKTSTRWAPWHVVAANFKWHARVKVLETHREDAGENRSAPTRVSPLFLVRAGLLAAALCGATACDRLFDKGSQQNIDAADAKAKAGDVQAAIKLYEGALDGSPKTADVHYKLALLYADKLASPLDAMHHFSRYLALAPAGAHAKEAKDYKREGEGKLLAIYSKGSPVNQDEAVRIRNQNLALQKQLNELRAAKIHHAHRAAGRREKGRAGAKAGPARRPHAHGGRARDARDHRGEVLQKQSAMEGHPGRELLFGRWDGEDSAGDDAVYSVGRGGR